MNILNRLFLLSFILLIGISFSQLKVELITPQNGLYTNPGPISFIFNTTNTTSLEELKDKIDPKNLTCYLVLQIGNRYLKQGPLNLPLGEKGEFEYKSFPPNTYIWSVQCNGFSSEYRVLIVQNQSFEEFVEQLKTNKTNTTANKSEREVENKAQTENKTNDQDYSTLRQNQNQLIFYFLVGLIFLIVLIYFIVNSGQKQKNQQKNEKEKN
ncbi:MAG: hypothetical protein QXH71_04320 [Candidatus Anstonellaceae archaeon]